MYVATYTSWRTRVNIRGGVPVALSKNILQKEWEDMYREAYITYEVINKPKIHEVLAARKAPPTGGRGGRIWGTRGDTYAE